MKHSEQLRTLLVNEVLPEVEQFMSKMEEFAGLNEQTPEIEQEVAGLQAIHQNFLNILQAIENSEITEENCEELIGEINKLRSMGVDTPL